jgi:micrococcal nuclease
MYEYKALVVRIIDGDTVRLKVDLGFNINGFEENFRLAEIDTPELRDKDPTVKQAAYDAKAALAEMLPVGDIITIKTDKDDKYGRWLVYITSAAGVNVNEALVKQGHAVPYTK